jgi:hypothetical protein
VSQKQQVPHNPFIKPSSQYGCAVADCNDHGAWSPMVNGPTWYCRKHAGLPEPAQRWQPKQPLYTPEEIAEAKRKVRAFSTRGTNILQASAAILEPPSDEWWQRLSARWRNGEPLLIVQMQMVTQAWINAHRPPDWTPPDEEARLEREAIQNE